MQHGKYGYSLHVYDTLLFSNRLYKCWLIDETIARANIKASHEHSDLPFPLQITFGTDSHTSTNAGPIHSTNNGDANVDTDAHTNNGADDKDDGGANDGANGCANGGANGRTIQLAIPS